MSDDPLLVTERLSKSFGGVAANRSISLAVQRGAICGLIGPNGSGKTTLFSLIAGAQSADSGVIRFNGADITGLSERRVAMLGLARTFQQPRVYRAMTCLQNVLTGAAGMTAASPELVRAPDRASRVRARELLGFAGLGDRAEDAAESLSFGQKKLLEFAMALNGAPRILLLDEPCAGVSPARVERVLDLLRTTRAEFGMTLFVIEHNMEAIMNVADTIHCVVGGELIGSGTPEVIRRDQRVLAAYLGTT